MIELFAVIFTLFVIAIIAFMILNAVGVPCYPRPKFTCAECEQSQEKNGIYKCKACRDEVTNELLSCCVTRGTKDCYDNAKKASNEQQQE